MSGRGGAARLGLIAAVALACASGGLYFRYVARDQVWPRRFGVVEAGKVYRSGRLPPGQIERLSAEHGIRTIVDLGAHEPGSAEERVERRTAQALGLRRHVFHLAGDGTGAAQDYVEALKIINDPSQQPVLVHCAAGTHRTSVCVILYKHRGDDRPLLDDLKTDAEAYGYDQGRTPATARYLEEWGPRILGAFRSGATLGPTTLEPGAKP